MPKEGKIIKESAFCRCLAPRGVKVRSSIAPYSHGSFAERNAILCPLSQAVSYSKVWGSIFAIFPLAAHLRLGKIPSPTAA
jgi:hypothetical protein